MDSSFFKKVEYQGLKKLYQNSPKNPRQCNGFNSSDVEILQLKNNLFLISSTDSLAIEIHSGLYKDPATWGYLAVANSISDLAASGAKPLGMLISAQWKKQHHGTIKANVYKGMADALKRFQVPLLGGDSGSSHETVLTTTILGEAPTKPLSRIGIHPGDLILLFGKNLGYGPATAFDYLYSKSSHQMEKKFRPDPNWKSILKFRRYFKASIDTSDGIYNSLLTLSALNNVQFTLVKENIKFSSTIELYKKRFSIPLEYLIESDLGDLQTCVSIDPAIYKKIKSKLPFHQIITFAEEKTYDTPRVSYSTSASYSVKMKKTKYRFLSDIVAETKEDYRKSLRLWLKQFSV